MPTRQTFSEELIARLIWVMEKRDVSIHNIADKLHYSRTFIERVLLEPDLMTLGLFFSICEMVKVSPSFILENKREEGDE